MLRVSISELELTWQQLNCRGLIWRTQIWKGLFYLKRNLAIRGSAKQNDLIILTSILMPTVVEALWKPSNHLISKLSNELS